MVEKMEINNINDLEKKLYDFKIIFAYHSNKIENNEIDFHDTREIFENGSVTGFTGNLITLFEIQNQSICYEYLKEHIVSKKAIDIDFIKKTHYKLTKGTYDEYRYNINKERAREFKKHDYVTGINEVGSYPHEAERDLKELLDEMNSYEGNDHFTVGIYFHAMFENIHPFADGNGRVGRALMNYYFMIHDIAPVVIYNEDKKEYYRSLEVFDKEDSDIVPLKEFIIKEQEKTWSKEREPKKKKINKVFDDFDLERQHGNLAM